MTWDKETILGILNKPEAQTGGKQNRYLIYRMLQAMYQRQTADEQTSQYTKYRNNVGFNGLDAQFLSSVAEGSQKYKNLTPKQAAAVAKRLKKYIGQLVEIALEHQKPIEENPIDDDPRADNEDSPGYRPEETEQEAAQW